MRSLPAKGREPINAPARMACKSLLCLPMVNEMIASLRNDAMSQQRTQLKRRNCGVSDTVC